MRLRRIGGRGASQIEREHSTSWRAFVAAPTATVSGTWRDQCFCGSAQGKYFRRAHWCPRCGREKGEGFPHDR